jgi:hypothetical protein
MQLNHTSQAFLFKQFLNGQELTWHESSLCWWSWSQRSDQLRTWPGSGLQTPGRFWSGLQAVLGQACALQRIKYRTNDFLNFVCLPNLKTFSTYTSFGQDRHLGHPVQWLHQGRLKNKLLLPRYLRNWERK